MTSTPAGWYDDGRGAFRWWDGEQWTEHVQPRPVEATAAPAETGALTETAAQLAPVAPAQRGWLVPLIVIGSFVLLVLLAIAVVPALVKSVATGGYSGDELAAVEAVQAFDAAWQSADCDGFEATTSEDLRTTLSIPDCDAFEEASASFQDATDDYDLRVTDVEEKSGVITVRTEESYTSYLDDDENPVPGFDAVSDVEYTVIESGGAWLIDDTFYLGE